MACAATLYEHAQLYFSCTVFETMITVLGRGRVRGTG
jgi:hypothetical protein